ncbi:MAG: DUF3343 domain-containing protein [Gemmatimonadota bacterium]
MIRLLTFDTTHHALHAEQLALEHGLAAQVTPAPADSKAKCDLALEYLPDEEPQLIALLRDAGVEFAVYEVR